MECGNFSGVSARCRLDTIASLHTESDTEGQLLEKMISGRYLGEIVRLAVIHQSSGWTEGFRGWTGTRAGQHVEGAIRVHYRDISPTSHTTPRTDLAATGNHPPRAWAWHDALRKKTGSEPEGHSVSALERGLRGLWPSSIVATATCVDPDLERGAPGRSGRKRVQRLSWLRDRGRARDLLNLLGDRADMDRRWPTYEMDQESGQLYWLRCPG